jgi:hypothetical protein
VSYKGDNVIGSEDLLFCLQQQWPITIPTVNASAKVTKNTDTEAIAIFPASLSGGWEFEATYIHNEINI